jgi:nucleoside-diphosphate-sugar epimerase
VLTVEGIAPNDRILVTGGAGWLGREMFAWLRRYAPETPAIAVGTRTETVRLHSGVSFQCNRWQDFSAEEWKPTLIVHLAFLTKERSYDMAVATYEAENRRISQAALRLLDTPTVRGVVTVSAGAAIQQLGHVYGRLKADDEAVFTTAGSNRGIASVIARAWSLSGAFCTKPRHFLLYDLIRQTTADRYDIAISADHLVWRRYVDAGEFLGVALSAAACGWSGVIDSTGPLLEAAELADLIQRVLGTNRRVLRPELAGEPDRYFSDSVAMDQLAKHLGVQISDMQQQIRTSTLALTGPQQPKRPY